jgi:hypothetical protein
VLKICGLWFAEDDLFAEFFLDDHLFFVLFELYLFLLAHGTASENSRVDILFVFQFQVGVFQILFESDHLLLPLG